MMRPLMLLCLAVCGCAGLKYTQTFRDTFTVEWTPDESSSKLEVCGSVNGTADTWVAIGFSAKKGGQMKDSDIVAGYMGAGSKPTVSVLYSLNATGYPAGTPTLTVTDQSFAVDGSNVKVCFTRAYTGGHHTIVSGSNPFIWAHGKTAAGGAGITYHGKEKTDRCDDFTIDWFKGPQQ